ncbi:hypothetical protein [Helicobacter sp. 11S02629-2]|uniref:hypothetical protein n=1 Tax=Helicobacter sp. 11S02629-2 TaxID=1476195 RepID=UPI000BA57AFD|nr:hypothetical protein [Helicobacter sp. 11S02629-2]PAF42745.1 hypothetical protein BKH40_07575 [Helicobacter sp. 11S02629-2]
MLDETRDKAIYKANREASFLELAYKYNFKDEASFKEHFLRKHEKKKLDALIQERETQKDKLRDFEKNNEISYAYHRGGDNLQDQMRFTDVTKSFFARHGVNLPDTYVSFSSGRSNPDISQYFSRLQKILDDGANKDFDKKANDLWLGLQDIKLSKEFKYYPPITLGEFFNKAKKYGFFANLDAKKENLELNDFFRACEDDSIRNLQDWDRRIKPHFKNLNVNNEIILCIIMAVRFKHFHSNALRATFEGLERKGFWANLMGVVIDYILPIVGIVFSALTLGLGSPLGIATLAIGTLGIGVSAISFMVAKYFNSRLKTIESEVKNTREEALKIRQESLPQAGARIETKPSSNLSNFAGGSSYNALKDGNLDYMGNATKPFLRMIGEDSGYSSLYKLNENFLNPASPHYYDVLSSKSSLKSLPEVQQAFIEAAKGVNLRRFMQQDELLKRLRQKDALLYPLLVFSHKIEGRNPAPLRALIDPRFKHFAGGRDRQERAQNTYNTMLSTDLILLESTEFSYFLDIGLKLKTKHHLKIEVPKDVERNISNIVFYGDTFRDRNDKLQEKDRPNQEIEDAFNGRMTPLRQALLELIKKQSPNLKDIPLKDLYLEVARTFSPSQKLRYDRTSFGVKILRLYKNHYPKGQQATITLGNKKAKTKVHYILDDKIGMVAFDISPFITPKFLEF